MSQACFLLSAGVLQDTRGMRFERSELFGISPRSISRIVTLGRELKREARTHPAVPPFENYMKVRMVSPRLFIVIIK